MSNDFVNISEDGGLRKKILREGDATTLSPPSGSSVDVHYVGRLTDGTVFDSSRDRNAPFAFTLGQGQVIRGWDMGVATMKLGELCELECSAEYAYGEHGSPPKIPPNATLIFEVELLDYTEKVEGDKERLGVAKKKKERGNEKMVKKEYASALVAYDKGLDVLDMVSVSDREDVDEDEKEMRREAKTLKTTLKLNRCQCLLNLERYQDALEACNEVIRMDPRNVKAVYRRGLSRMHLGDYEQAETELSRSMDSYTQLKENKELNMLLERIRREHRLFLKKEKQVYAKMFQ